MDDTDDVKKPSAVTETPVTVSGPTPKAALESQVVDATPAPSSSAPAAANDAGNVREAVTKGGMDNQGTSATVIALAACGAVAAVALVVVAAMARRKKIEEKRRDMDADSAALQRTFAVAATPGSYNVGML
jgi:hypothetical protein